MGAPEEKSKVFNELSKIPGNIVSARKNSVDLAQLSIDMINATGEALTTENLQETCEELGKQRSILKASVSSGQIKFKFNTNTNYQSGIDFQMPTSTNFGYVLVDNNGNILPLTDTSAGDSNDISNFYLTKNKSTNELVSIDHDLPAFLAPSLTQDIIEEIGILEAEDSIVRGKLSSNPISKVYPIPTIEIFLNDPSEEKIAEIDETGTLIILSNGSGVIIDESASFVNLKTKDVEIHFSTPPIVPATLSFKYDYTVSENTTSETHTNFDSNNYIFSRTLSNTPNISSIIVYLNDQKKALTNNSGKIYSMEVSLPDSFYDSVSNKIRVKFNNITTDVGNTVRFDYTIKDVAEKIDNLGGFGESSVTFPTFQTQNGNIDLSSVKILLDSTIVATSDSSGNITGSYDTIDSVGTGTITGTIDQSGGLSSLTFTGPSGGKAYPSSDKVVYLSYDFVSGLSDWQSTYDFIDINSLSVNSNGVNIINLVSSDISNTPEILKTYPLKRYSNHQIYGNIIVVTEGLEINTDWLPVYIRNDGVIDISSSNTQITSTDFNTSGFSDNVHSTQTLRLYDYNGTEYTDYTISSHTGNTIIITGTFPVSSTSIKFEIIWGAEDATIINDTSFKTYFGWLKPVNESVDDIIKSSNPDNISDTSGAPSYPNIRLNPFFPAVEGNHAASQPGSLGDNDIFAGFYFHDDPGTPTNDYDINSDVRWLFGPEPPKGTQTFTDIVEPDMYTFKGITYATDDIPEDGFPDSGDIYTMGSDNYIKKNGSNFTCKYNDVQSMLEGDMYQAIQNLETLRLSSSGGTGYIDSNYPSDDTIWWGAVESITIDLNALELAHVEWRNQYVDGVADSYYNSSSLTNGNPSTLADTFLSELNGGTADFYNTCFDVSTGRLKVIETRFGSPIVPGYIKDLYTLSNMMAGKDVGYVKDTVKSILGNTVFYDRIEVLRKKYRAWEQADPN